MAQPVVRIERTAEVLQSASTAQVEDVLADERWCQRHSRLRRQQDRDDFVAARVLALDLATQALGRPVRLTQSCPSCGRPGHGRPMIEGAADLAVSWAHSSGVVGAAVMCAESVGFDLERARPDAPVAPELSLTGRAFVRAEALVKTGLMGLDEALAFNPSWPWLPTKTHATTVNGRRVTLHDIDAPGQPGIIASVAWT